MEGFIKSLLMISLMTILASCGGGGGGGGGSSSDDTELSDEAKALAAANGNLVKIGANENGLLNGAPTDIVDPKSFVEFLSSRASNYVTETDFDYKTDCKTSGTPVDTFSNTSPGYPIYYIYCNLMKRPDGPDTIRGAIDRASGWLCALGKVNYDGKARKVKMKITTSCFSEEFTDMAVEYLGGKNTIEATVKGFKSPGDVVPSDFDKYLTFDAGELVKYTIAVKEGSNERAIAVYGGLPGEDEGDAFSIYMNKADGEMKVEGRFAPPEGELCSDKSDEIFCRHVRFHMIGELNSNFEITNVEDLHVLLGERTYMISLSGTPAAGRKLRYLNGTDDWDSSSAASDDDEECYGEDGALCTDNDGIIIPDGGGIYVFADGSGYTLSKDWFAENSYLGTTGNLTDAGAADIWSAVK